MLRAVSADPWRTNGDTVERVELLAIELVSRTIDDFAQRSGRSDGGQSSRISRAMIKPSGRSLWQGQNWYGILTALDGRFVAPGPSGAPTRGRPDVLPTGRNFYSVDSRAVPTPAAWELGQKSAELLVTRATFRITANGRLRWR
jgi:cobaltochelatase CobN